MRILDGSRLLGGEVELHLTETEAARLIGELRQLRAEVADMGMDPTMGNLVSDAEVIEARVYVYRTAASLDAEVADRLTDPG
jgi:hypothetical protein